jgi:hypothetical protein
LILRIILRSGPILATAALANSFRDFRVFHMRMTTFPDENMTIVTAMRRWAAGSDEFCLVVRHRTRTTAFFKDEIDAAETDEKLLGLLNERCGTA